MLQLPISVTPSAPDIVPLLTHNALPSSVGMLVLQNAGVRLPVGVAGGVALRRYILYLISPALPLGPALPLA